MCAQCVGQATPMIVAGMAFLRRDALGAWISTRRRGPDADAGADAEAGSAPVAERVSSGAGSPGSGPAG